MKLTRQTLIFISVLVTLTCQNQATTESTADIIVPKISEWQVTVVNGLVADKNLYVHCRSKEDDLGERNLTSEESFTWGFRQNIIHTTLFWCYMSKHDVHAKLNVFWDDVILFHRCGWKTCVWIAKDDGVYLRDFATGDDLISTKWEVGL
ncbi:PREDICTED: uncharacterized protein LOC104814676 [Tarenaya hassleriana]|uniref:uncharacterized protein LOC104814676 n=1 Tax=Tarenaya hassleriana TaxID=28532 RepID=UPI00053CA77C|nr:PREDICTED: uncharacterized protein LOC104814676 [Tarenaya hassleriana]